MRKLHNSELKVLRKLQFLPLVVLKKCSLFDTINIDMEMVMKMYKRKATEKLREWKEKYSNKLLIDTLFNVKLDEFNQNNLGSNLR